jgi:hypothetical protein
MLFLYTQNLWTPIDSSLLDYITRTVDEYLRPSRRNKLLISSEANKPNQSERKVCYLWLQKTARLLRGRWPAVTIKKIWVLAVLGYQLTIESSHSLFPNTYDSSVHSYHKLFAFANWQAIVSWRTQSFWQTASYLPLNRILRCKCWHVILRP